jgi:curved DNA-binding protein CbpA
VKRGLDFYKLLEVHPTSDQWALARRYRQLRTHFPDDPSNLAPEPARRLALLEAAGRILTDPQLRTIYDNLRQNPELKPQVQLGVLRCECCSAPFAEESSMCLYCGTPRPPEPSLPAAPPTHPAPDVDPVDFYALLGVSAAHLLETVPAEPLPLRGGWGAFDVFGRDDRNDYDALRRVELPRLPTAEAIDLAARERQRHVLLLAGLTPEERQQREDQLEIARRMLRDERRRSIYDALLRAIREGKLDAGRLDALHSLQNEVLAEIVADRGEPLSAKNGEMLLQQGLGLLEAGLPRDAADKLRKALKALPHSAHGHAAFVQAMLSKGDPIDLGPHALREVQRSLNDAIALGTPLPDSAAINALCRGLLARDSGDARTAEAELRNAVDLAPHLAPAWRGLAALALVRGANEEVLSAGRQALAHDPTDERSLQMMLAACLRSRQRQAAHQLATQIAQLRGNGWHAEKVLSEMAII